MDRILDTRLGKHYLPATTVAGGNTCNFDFTKPDYSRAACDCFKIKTEIEIEIRVLLNLMHVDDE